MADNSSSAPPDTAHRARESVPSEQRPHNSQSEEAAAASAAGAQAPSKNRDRHAGPRHRHHDANFGRQSHQSQGHQGHHQSHQSHGRVNKPKFAGKPQRNPEPQLPIPSGDVRNYLNENGNLSQQQDRLERPDRVERQEKNQNPRNVDRNKRNPKNHKRKIDDHQGPRRGSNELNGPSQAKSDPSASHAAELPPSDDATVTPEPSRKEERPRETKSREKAGGRNKSKLLETRADILIDQLEKNQLECMVCCFVIRKDKAIWSCDKCFHIFHLYCIKKWASTAASKIEEASNTWRCPGCQAPHETIPNRYQCFCGKKLDPQDHLTPRPNLQRITPHSCGEVCGKPLENSAKLFADDRDLSARRIPCTHKCTQPCHPGPCPTCESIITRSCNCGKRSFQVKCSSTKVPMCTNECDLFLNCGLHKCGKLCHPKDECGACDVDVQQTCFSHDDERVLKCGSEELRKSSEKGPAGWAEHYRCTRPCGKLLACGNHYCADTCHDGPCKECALLPSNLKKCPCGKTAVSTILVTNRIIRTKCTDPIPTCEKSCERILHEHGAEIHVCQSKCHNGECPPCTKLIDVKCRCGKESEQMACHKNTEQKLCERRCNKKKTCGRHQCNEICCSSDHICMLVCNRLLDCGNHKCENLCHKNPCPRCLVADFNERVCHCGKTVQYPPIRCGTKPLECPHLCDREHNCEHPVVHNCHWSDECPPCMYLTSKVCVGNHEMRHNIPCHIKEISCGRVCNKPLESCDHKCQRTCHKGACSVPGEPCVQACAKSRPYCDHVCATPCHFGKPCPDTVCQEMVQVSCKCGLKSKRIVCGQRMYEASSQVVFENLASDLKEMLLNKTIDLASFSSPDVLKKKHELACDEECAIAERNKRFAMALDLDPSSASSGFPKPIYSDFLKTFSRDNHAFALDIEKQLEAIVKEVNTSTKTALKKTYNYPVMKSYERKFIHELASYYGMETISHDTEPERYVSIYATKGKCYVPSPSLLQSSELKSKYPTMMMPSIKLQLKSETNKESGMLLLNPTRIQADPFDDKDPALNAAQATASAETKSTAESQKVVDYFDMTD